MMSITWGEPVMQSIDCEPSQLGLMSHNHPSTKGYNNRSQSQHNSITDTMARIVHWTIGPESSDFSVGPENSRQDKSSFFFIFFFTSTLSTQHYVQNKNFSIRPVQYLACQNTQRMYKVPLIVTTVQMVYKLEVTNMDLWPWESFTCIKSPMFLSIKNTA